MTDIFPQLKRLKANFINSETKLEKTIELSLVSLLVTVGIIHTSDTLKGSWFNNSDNSNSTRTLPQQVVINQGSQSPSFREILNNAKEYQQSISALQTPITASPQEVKNQGFVIHPINNLRKQIRPDLNKGLASSPQVENQSILPKQSNSSENEDEVLYAKNREIKSIQRVEKPYFSIDKTNKSRIINAANSLELGTSRVVAKKTLGKPNRESLVADGSSKQLLKMLVYTLTMWKQGTSTPYKDEFIVLLFDSSDQLVSLETHNEQKWQTSKAPKPTYIAYNNSR